MKKSKNWVILLVLSIVLMAIVAIFFLQTSSNKNHQEVIIKKNWNSDSLNIYFNNNFKIEMPLGLAFWAEKAGYKITPCKFFLPPNSNPFKIIRTLRENRNQTINLVIIPGIWAESLSERISSKLIINYGDIHGELVNPSLLLDYGFNDTTWPALIIPNTYNISVGISVEGFFDRMKAEHEIFWDSIRTSKLKNQNLSLLQAVTIASLVQKESNKIDEYTKIAGVYINRYRKGMKLQADPTIVFAKGKAERVRGKEDLFINSPYNTYIHKGLPPGPICIPSVEAINAVLNYTKHDYLYFCAKSDFSGYHIFEFDYNNHKKNASAFHRALNREELKSK
ncbi:MAG: endolytic transglycosylase MltG [Bacteroidia bacterium]|nr:endolytic transglycosylase MltG [Bacteroidia bacterium]